MWQTTSTKSKAGLFMMAMSLWTIGLNGEDTHVYTTGFSSVLKLGGDLHDALPQKYYDQVDAQAVTMQPQDMPLIAPVSVTADNHVSRQVEFSAGFLDLANHLSHAKAIDKVQPGFFDQYVGQLAHAYTTSPATPIPPITDARFWTEDILNDQLSYFNQMMGTMMAINMAHHYMGNYAKYASKLTGPDNKVVPINSLLTPAEWDNAVKAGALDALNCAISTEGLRVLLDALDKMPTRPEWAAYIAPDKADFKKLIKQMAKFEEDFYHGRIKN
jgi:hypothetical protein